MRETMDMTKKELAVFFLMAVLSGFMIGIGGTASLLANSLLGVWGKLIGAVLFSLGIYAIVTYGMKLFTGMVADIPKMGMKSMWRLPLCFFGNIIGVAIVAVLVYNSPLSTPVVAQGKATVAAKLAQELSVPHLVLWHTEDKNYADRKALYNAEAEQYYKGDLYVPNDLEVITL